MGILIWFRYLPALLFDTLLFTAGSCRVHNAWPRDRSVSDLP